MNKRWSGLGSRIIMNISKSRGYDCGIGGAAAPCRLMPGQANTSEE